MILKLKYDIKVFTSSCQSSKDEVIFHNNVILKKLEIKVEIYNLKKVIIIKV